jgi:inner membrane protein
MAGVTSPRISVGPRMTGLGAKALLVFALALVMAIPGAFVFALLAEREHRADTVIHDVSALQGGSQAVLGPMLAAPYVIPAPPRAADAPANQPPPGPETGWYVVSPDSGEARVTVHGSNLHRSIFDVPVYDASADITAHFSGLPKNVNLPAGAVVDWRRAQIVVGLSDLRGAKADVTGVFQGKALRSSLVFNPASGVEIGAPGGGNTGFGLVAAPADALVASPEGGDFKASLRFTGAQRLSVLPFAKSTVIDVAGDWPSPSFDGGFLPESRHLGAKAFSARWSVPFIARGLADHGPASALSLDGLGAKDLGVTFVAANNPYKSVERALKYAVMVVGLVFLTFFVFEALSGRRIHPAQYLLIGSAQMVFYLLLLSVSEYLGFDLAFAAAAVATVLLIGFYAGAAFKSRAYGARALVVFALVYGLIYLLLRLEDFALLAGSVASFLGLAAGMYLTRNVDWYGARTETAAPPAASPSGA